MLIRRFTRSPACVHEPVRQPGASPPGWSLGAWMMLSAGPGKGERCLINRIESKVDVFREQIIERELKPSEFFARPFLSRRFGSRDKLRMSAVRVIGDR